MLTTEAIQELLIGHEGIVDLATFEQILEMDEADDRSFSHSIVAGFFEQAQETVDSLDKACKNHDLTEASSLGHFLKGSSATLGFPRVRNTCEKIQRYGKMELLDGTPYHDMEDLSEKIKEAITQVKSEIIEARDLLRKVYVDENESGETSF